MAATRSDDVHDIESRQDPKLVRALEMVAPGTALREGIDNILDARTGGLLVIGELDELAFLFSGGIKIDIDYSPALLYQLAKMDGAITLNANATKIADGERPADARPDDPVGRDRHPAPHRRARRQADRRARDRDLAAPRGDLALRRRRSATSSRTSPSCWPRPTRRSPRSTSTAPASIRSRRGSRRSSSRAAARCTTC